jgi:hypothetical protein
MKRVFLKRFLDWPEGNHASPQSGTAKPYMPHMSAIPIIVAL